MARQKPNKTSKPPNKRIEEQDKQPNTDPLTNTTPQSATARKKTTDTIEQSENPQTKPYRTPIQAIYVNKDSIMNHMDKLERKKELKRQEEFSQRYHVTVDSYHADNGAFRSETFQKAIDNKNQKLNFSGVNAKWQNGLVEQLNGTLCAAARSMLNHAISKWDKTITPELWPFAIQQAGTIYNTTKRRSRDYDISPWEKFTGECSKLNQSDMHPLLCPVYVLDRRM
jgi:hypothetical protein